MTKTGLYAVAVKGTKVEHWTLTERLFADREAAERWAAESWSGTGAETKDHEAGGSGMNAKRAADFDVVPVWSVHQGMAHYGRPRWLHMGDPDWLSMGDPGWLCLPDPGGSSMRTVRMSRHSAVVPEIVSPWYPFCEPPSFDQLGAIRA